MIPSFLSTKIEPSHNLRQEASKILNPGFRELSEHRGWASHKSIYGRRVGWGRDVRVGSSLTQHIYSDLQAWVGFAVLWGEFVRCFFFLLLLFGRGGGRAFSVVQSETICRGMPTSPWRRCPRVPGHVNRYLRERKTLIVRVILSVWDVREIILSSTGERENVTAVGSTVGPHTHT